MSNHPPTKNVISLIGYRGTGKSSVGKLLAEKLGYRFFDSDDEVEKQAGTNIANIFSEHGEESFRKLEQKTISELTQSRNIVLSTGGGAILKQENRSAIQSSGPVIWLTADVDTIIKRMQGDQSSTERRPALTDLPAREEVISVLDHRMPLYEECATFSIGTDTQNPSQIVEEILKNLDGYRSEETH